MAVRSPLVAVLWTVVGLSGCATFQAPFEAPEIVKVPDASSKSRNSLIAQYPEGHVPYNIGIYNCVDTTGQKRKGSDGSTDFSSAVPQDCSPFLISSFRALPYYRVLERSRIDEVVRERQLAVAMHGELGKKILGTLHIADAIVMGQIVSHDRTSSQAAGGLALSAVGVAYEYVSDTFTFSLRVVSTKSGEFIDDVLIKKTITSLQADGHILRLIGVDMAGAEYGAAINETTGIALKEAVDLAVRTLTEQGIRKGWLLDPE